MYAEHVDRDTFLAFGPFHPKRLAEERRMEDEDDQWSCALEEAVEKAYQEGKEEEATERTFRKELEREIESLKAQLAQAPNRMDVYDLGRALRWIAGGRDTKKGMIEMAKKAINQYDRAKYTRQQAQNGSRTS